MNPARCPLRYLNVTRTSEIHIQGVLTDHSIDLRAQSVSLINSLTSAFWQKLRTKVQKPAARAPNSE